MTEKVLLVDDEEEFVETLAERMRTRGMDVATTNSGADGLEALQRIKRRRPDIQVVLLTGYATVEKGVEAIKLGALEFLEKPVDLASLTDAIHKAKATKMVLVEKETEERIKDILEHKGW